MKKKGLPLLEVDLFGESITNPSIFVNYIKKIRKLPERIPPTCLFLYSNDLINSIRSRFPSISVDLGTEIPNILHFVKKGEIEFGMIHGQIGAPASAVQLEELIALGFKNFVTIGSTGGLKKYLKPGDIILPTRAIRCEGTSYHYLSPYEDSYPSQKILKHLREALYSLGVKFYEGTCLTTDAFYRETLRDMEKYRKRGVVCVDMEVAALYAVGKFRNVDVGSSFWLWDQVIEPGRWNPDYQTKRINKAKNDLVEVAIKVCESLSSEEK
ncbi:MAG: nucleoside phosphorylase [Candidatus Aenigmatarchaeota archaeon]